VTIRAPLSGRVSRDLRLTRDLLDRLPDSSMAWRPHPRSFSLGGLGTHLARLPHWGVQILARDHYDLAVTGGHREAPGSRADILALFDRHATEWTAAMASVTEAALAATWQLRRGTTVLESMSHAEAVERYLLHHLIHHRGQLTVYLRQLDVSLPPLYGPTADEDL
jgi:uncharacterized damage-inducible protein DinB